MLPRMLPVLLGVVATMSTLPMATPSAAFSTDITMATARADAARLREDIKNNPQAKQKVTPLMNITGTPRVFVTAVIAVLTVLGIDDASQLVRSALYVELWWTDPLLAWDPANYSNLAEVELPTDVLWTPDVRVINTMEQKIIADDARTLTLNSSGGIKVNLPVVVETSCVMDLTNFPFDKQTCPVSFYSFRGKDISVSVNRDAFRSFIISSRLRLGNDWDLVDVQVGDFKIGEDDWPFPNLLMTLQRKTTFYVLCLVVPIVLTSYMNTFVFLLPLESGEKVSFLISVFVSTSVFISYFTSVMPRGLDSLPNLMKLLLGVIVQSLIVLLGTIVVLHLHYHQERCDDHNRKTTDKNNRSEESNSSSDGNNECMVSLIDAGNPPQKVTRTARRHQGQVAPVPMSQNPRKATKRARWVPQAKNLDHIFFAMAFIGNSMFVFVVLFSSEVPTTA
ncbi:acetylcholine receptor subunit beta-like 1 [Littorina saxatilis]|uniref:acetylcholine receptor subunit beta-like 1 n=1 Tax=Littorina saxatilis TaxID=31220 RepID=UPI0038B4408C